MHPRTSRRFFASGRGAPESLSYNVSSNQVRRRLSAYIGAARTAEELDSLLRDRPQQPQIALVARSNAGKSSLVNALVGEKVAIASKTPGRTRIAHAFQARGFVLVDLPGYGFAKGTAGEEGEKMTNVIYECALDREQTNLVLLLLDARRGGLMESDEMMAKALRKQNVPFQVIFTKIDCLNNTETAALNQQYPKAMLTSSAKSVGITALRTFLVGVKC